MEKPVVLIVHGQEESAREALGYLLRENIQLVETHENSHALKLLKNKATDLVVIFSPEKDARKRLELGANIRQVNKQIPIILVPDYSSEELAIAALKVGFNEYIKIPYTRAQFLGSVKRLLSESSQTCSAAKETKIPELDIDRNIIGKNALMCEVKTFLPKVARADSTVLITGETGTGKERVAELVHKLSPRRKAPYICINCAAMPDGLLESELFGHEKGAFTGASSKYVGKLRAAGGGTVFLDEIGDMSSYAQAKILRVVEGREVHPLGANGKIALNIRLVAATNKDLDHLVREGDFRDDLYFRLNVARIHLPPLRERTEDIPLLVEHFISQLNCQFGVEVDGLTEEALDVLLHYDWPGNVRELKNLLEALFINLPCSRITVLDLPESLYQQCSENEGTKQSEKEKLLAALLATNWNKSKEK
jgi:DNA-binding NtrC family response regulator